MADLLLMLRFTATLGQADMFRTTYLRLLVLLDLLKFFAFMVMYRFLAVPALHKDRLSSMYDSYRVVLKFV